MIPLCLGGCRLNVRCTPEEVDRAAGVYYAAFLADDTDGSATDMDIAVHFEPLKSDITRQRSLLEANVCASEDGYALDEEGIRGTISLTRRKASLHLSGGEPLRDLEYFLRVVVALLVRGRDGLLVHGAALVHDEGAYLFIGRSGSGKSTVVALSPHATALSDDLVVLTPGSGRWMVHGTPFWNWQTANRSGQGQHAPLAGIYKLVQSRLVRTTLLSVAAATAELVVNCPIVNGIPDLLPELMATCRRLAISTPVQSLEFRKDSSFWQVIEPAEASR